jgi:hypothetical protein
MNQETETTVSGDGDTVWINSPSTCIGRFSKRFGMDIHNTLEGQEKSGLQCLHCTHEPANFHDWRVFCELMLKYHQVVVSINLISFEDKQ